MKYSFVVTTHLPSHEGKSISYGAHHPCPSQAQVALCDLGCTENDPPPPHVTEVL